MTNIELGFRQGMEISWRQQPLMLVEGAEILQNMTRAVPEGEDLNNDYLNIRRMILEDNFALIGATGRNKAGKGSMLMGFYRALKQDEELKFELERKGFTLEIITVPFVQEREVAQLPGTDPLRGSLIPPRTGLPFSEWRFAHPRRISKLQWSDINSVFPAHLKTKEELRDYFAEQKKAVVVLVEASTPLVRPLSKIKETRRRLLKDGPPVVVRGLQDLGLSSLFNIAVDQRFRDNCRIYFVMKGQDLKEDEVSNNFRKNPSFNHENEIKVVVTVDGNEVDLSALSEEEQEKYAAVIARSIASSELVEQLDGALDSFEKELFKKGIIHEPSDMGLFRFISGTLDAKSFKRVLNPKFRGRKTYDLDYLLTSLIYRNHPEIYPELLTP